MSQQQVVLNVRSRTSLQYVRTLETPSIVSDIDRGVLTDVARYAALWLKIQTPTIHMTVRAF